MSEVRYSINGNYFKSFGVYVSESKGLGDTLKRKKSNTYDWSEYNGTSIDLSKPRYESREIELECFIEGSNWQTLFDKFNTLIRDEFSKGGTQRLLIEPLGFKAMPYEVYLEDSVQVKKRFKYGQMFGSFSLKLIEPNPIKKVLYFTGSSLNLSYNSTSETEIFYGNGLKETKQGNVIITNKPILNRDLSEYPYNGRNYILDALLERFSDYTTGYDVNGKWHRLTASKLGNNEDFTLTFSGTNEIDSRLVLNDANGVKAITLKNVFEANTQYTLSFTLINDTAIGGGILITYTDNTTELVLNAPTGFVTAINKTVSKLSLSYTTVGIVKIYNPMFQIGNLKTDFKPSPESEKYIIIAGNINDLNLISTNANLLWDKL